MAEFEACILGLNMAIDINIQELLVIGDSDLLVHQNEFADALATLSSMIQHPDKNSIDPIPVRIHNQPAYCAHVEEEMDGNPWFHDIKEYLAKGEYLEHMLHLTKPYPRKSSQTLSKIILFADSEFPTPLLLIMPPISDLMKAMCETFKIKHKNSIAYRPQMNGAVEAATKNIKKILRKMVENHKQWHEKLPFALLGYFTTVHTSTGATLYMMVYGTEVVIPAEVEIPSLRIIQEVKLIATEWIWSCYEQLALIDGKRINVVFHGQLYQNRMSRAFNKRVKPRQFAPGQLVLKKIFPHQDEPKGKFSPNWQDPYIVHRVLTGGALILAEIDGEVSQKPINSDAFKRYYV
ncbi:uncharacterized protein [Nicotiana sylvestris]|uniref:uncharacterized protein n=1 Tax=Nicotiana sylvestris TaxID=4096 RepID=UPI00388C8EE8